METTEHLNHEEIDDALAYRMSEEAAEHLHHCRGCQVAVEWSRLAKLNQLNTIDNDWYCKTLEALAEGMKRKGNGLLYAIPGMNQKSRLARLSFEPASLTTVSFKGEKPKEQLTLPLMTPLVTSEYVERILRRIAKGELSAVEAAQQLVALGFEPDEAWAILK